MFKFTNKKNKTFKYPSDIIHRTYNINSKYLNTHYSYYICFKKYHISYNLSSYYGLMQNILFNILRLELLKRGILVDDFEIKIEKPLFLNINIEKTTVGIPQFVNLPLNVKGDIPLSEVIHPKELIHSACTLHFMINKINDYEPGLVGIIDDYIRDLDFSKMDFEKHLQRTIDADDLLLYDYPRTYLDSDDLDSLNPLNENNFGELSYDFYYGKLQKIIHRFNKRFNPELNHSSTLIHKSRDMKFPSNVYLEKLRLENPNIKHINNTCLCKCIICKKINEKTNYEDNIDILIYELKNTYINIGNELGYKSNFNNIIEL